jgi:thiol-disulfide isomerase/thioredoxin
MTSAVVAIVAALALAAGAGWLLTRRAGDVRAVPYSGDPQRPASPRSRSPREAGQRDQVDPDDLGLSRHGPTVVHFSAPWCAPCERVRRVVEQVCGDLDGVAHIELDLDTNPVAARRLSVLSLPTTFIFDVDGRQRYRTVGVPKADDLRSALTPLLT